MDEDIQVKKVELYSGPLAQDFKHAAKVTFTRPVKAGDEVQYAGAAVDAVTETFVKSKPYPYYIFPDVNEGADECVVYWSEDNEERLIAKAFRIDGKPDVEWQRYEVGDTVCYEAAAPGVGHQTFIVTRKDSTGLWGFCNEDTMYVPEDVI